MLSAPLHPPTMNDDDRLIRNMTQAEALELRSILAILLEGDQPPDPTLQERARAILLGGHSPAEEGEI
jgi:hypothetical protein